MDSLSRKPFVDYWQKRQGNFDSWINIVELVQHEKHWNTGKERGKRHIFWTKSWYVHSVKPPEIIISKSISYHYFSENLGCSKYETRILYF